MTQIVNICQKVTKQYTENIYQYKTKSFINNCLEKLKKDNYVSYNELYFEPVTMLLSIFSLKLGSTLAQQMHYPFPQAQFLANSRTGYA